MLEYLPILWASSAKIVGGSNQAATIVTFPYSEVGGAFLRARLHTTK